nr:transposase [Hydrogenibacillus schlegelii]
MIKKHQTNTAGIEDQIIALYARGVNIRDSQSPCNDRFCLYGPAVSPALISNGTNKLLPEIRKRQNRPLQPVYVVMFLDAFHSQVKQDGHIECG